MHRNDAKGSDVMKTLATIFGTLVLLAPNAYAQEWSRFRGPNGSGLAEGAAIPSQWTDKDYNWKAAIPGVGHSSPVLWGERLFLTSGMPKTGERLVLCLDAVSGKTKWTRNLTGAAYRIHQRNTFASATPAADAKRLFVSFATPAKYEVLALSHEDGKTLWEADLGPFKSQHGFAMSPIVHDDLVIVGGDQDKAGWLAALDAADGKVRWKIPRQSGNATFSTPCVYQPAKGEAQIIFTNWQHGITAVEPKTGAVIWEKSVFEPSKSERAIASPVVAGDLVLGTCGFVTAQKHFVAIKPGSSDKKIEPQEMWRVEENVAYIPSPIVKGERIFLCSERGVVSCLELATGKVVWQERLDAEFSASPICIDNRFFCISHFGEVFVLAAADRYAILARNDLGERVQSSPAVANGRLYLRTWDHLICLGKK